MKLILSRIKISVLHFISHLIKFKKNRIVFCLSGRNDYCCNPKYICEELIKNHTNYKIYFVVQKINKTSSFPKECKVLAYASIKHYFAHITSKIIIYNDQLPHCFPKKKNHIYICTWHAGFNYKSIGYNSIKLNVPNKRVFELQNPIPNYYIAGCQKFIDEIKTSFNYTSTKFLKCGLPRNDIIFNSNIKNNIKDRIIKKYKINTNNIVLYAPTFRDTKFNPLSFLNIKEIKSVLKHKFGGNWTFVFRGHAYDKNMTDKNLDLLDLSYYPDIQELIIASDVIISDYSSIMWDASFTEKPIFVFAPDYNEYNLYERSLNFNEYNSPFPFSRNTKELCNRINTFDYKIFKNNLFMHHKEAGSFQKKDSSKIIVSLIQRLNKK